MLFLKAYKTKLHLEALSQCPQQAPGMLAGGGGGAGTHFSPLGTIRESLHQEAGPEGSVAPESKAFAQECRAGPSLSSQSL